MEGLRFHSFFFLSLLSKSFPHLLVRAPPTSRAMLRRSPRKKRKKKVEALRENKKMNPRPPLLFSIEYLKRRRKKFQTKIISCRKVEQMASLSTDSFWG